MVTNTLYRNNENYYYIMTNLESLAKTAKFVQFVREQMEPAMAFSKMFDSAIKPLRDQIHSTNMELAVLKGLGISKNTSFKSIIEKEFEGTSVSFAAKQAIELQKTIFDTIRSIAFQHGQVFESLKSAAELVRQSYAFSQLNSLKFALNEISGQITTIAIASKQWELLEDFEKVSEQIAEVAENHDQQFGFTE